MSGKIFITISPASREPMYKQITDQVKDAIAAGDMKHGDQLPSIREMSEILKISAITIKRAYQDLESEGFIMTRAGLGSYVAEQDQQKIKDEKIGEIRAAINGIIESGRRYGISPEEILEIVKEELT